MNGRNEKIAARFGIAGLLVLITLAASASTVTFKPVQTYPVGTNPISVVLGDLNGDGNLDLAVLNSGSNNVTVLLGQCGNFTVGEMGPRKLLETIRHGVQFLETDRM